VRQAAPEGEQRLLGVAIETILPHGILDVLAGERVFEFGGKQRQAVQEQRQV
jgi:hypothetical protein